MSGCSHKSLEEGKGQCRRGLVTDIDVGDNEKKDTMKDLREKKF